VRTTAPKRAAPSAYPQAERVHDYARRVLAGNDPAVLAGRFVRMACQRHLDDLAHGPARGLVWRPEMANAALSFFEDVLFLSEEVPFKLQDFQAFIVGSLFGWYASDGYRRYHTAYIEMGKGSGKTPLGAGIGLYGLFIDREISPEVYSAATSADQAGICYKDAKAMVESSPELAKRCVVQTGNITVPARRGVFRPLSAEHRSLDGKRVHMAIVDELHEHSSDIVVDKISAGTKQRRNALILEITNSGHDRTSVCWRHHETSVAILEGRAQNDAWFAYVCALDPCPACLAAGKLQPDEACPHCDDWRNLDVLMKANPGLGTILPVSYLARQINDAATMVSKENLIKRLNGCIWTEQANRWLNMQKWDACAGPETPAALALRLRGRPCKLGLDASTVDDFSAIVLQFQDGDRWPVLPHFFIPQGNLKERIRKTGIRFDLWRDEGFLDTTPGDMIDYAWIRKKINDLGDLYDIQEIAYDPWNTNDLVTGLQADGFTCVPIRQGFATLSAPTKETEKDVIGGKLVHAGHPVLRWMAGNATITEDAAGNIKPDKERSTEKIDGIAALVMARDRWLRAAPVVQSAPGVMWIG
jgi:phage terminase large subunit-like protein